MNSCILMAEIVEEPQLRSTPDGKTVANVMVEFAGLRDEDPKGKLRVVGWGNLAEEIENSYHRGDRIIIEGRLSMVLMEMPEGYKEKRAELVASRIYPVGGSGNFAPKPTTSSDGNYESQGDRVNDFSSTPEPIISSPSSDDSNYEDLDEIPF